MYHLCIIKLNGPFVSLSLVWCWRPPENTESQDLVQTWRVEASRLAKSEKVPPTADFYPNCLPN